MDDIFTSMLLEVPKPLQQRSNVGPWLNLLEAFFCMMPFHMVRIPVRGLSKQQTRALFCQRMWFHSGFQVTMKSCYTGLTLEPCVHCSSLHDCMLACPWHLQLSRLHFSNTLRRHASHGCSKLMLKHDAQHGKVLAGKKNLADADSPQISNVSESISYQDQLL